MKCWSCLTGFMYAEQFKTKQNTEYIYLLIHSYLPITYTDIKKKLSHTKEQCYMMLLLGTMKLD